MHKSEIFTKTKSKSIIKRTMHQNQGNSKTGKMVLHFRMEKITNRIYSELRENSYGLY